MASQTPRLRFCPSPTGTPHVGLMRTALFNYAYAKHIGGQLVFRIEDTDAARDSEESYHQIIDALTWLGIRWDEGPDIGGPYGPYRQSERGEIYREVLAKLVEAQLVYESFSTADEIRQRHLDAGRRPELGYDNYDRNLSQQEIAEYKSQGKPSVLRLRMPEHDLAWDDLIRGRTVFAPGSVPDFPLTRANGQPLYAFVNVVDDALMKITHILRGEDLLPSTPRQLALYEALQSIGICDASPQYAHLPYVMGAGNKKLSKRDPEASFFAHRDRGFIAEGLVNYLALLGWGYSHDEDIFSLAQMMEKFDIHDVNANPARFDQKKADAINAEHIRRLSIADCANRINSFLVAKGLLTEPSDVVTQITPFIRTRITVLNDVWPLISFLFVSEEEFSYAEKAVAKNFTPEAIPVLQAAYEALAGVEQWDDATITEVLHNALVTELNLSPKQAFGSVRVAITGAVVSPPLFESIRILGKPKSLARLRSAIEYIESQPKKEASNS